MCSLLKETISYDYGTKYICDPGDGKVRTFYVLENSGDNVSLIMDQNIGGIFAWISQADYESSNTDGTICSYDAWNDEGPITLRNYLDNATSKWTNASVSIPTGNQIAIAGGLTNWTSGGSNQAGLPNWLYDNMYCNVNTCSESILGDNAGTGMIYGYWTASSHTNDVHSAWHVHYSGGINRYRVEYYTLASVQL